MELKLYNTYKRVKEVFTPLVNSKVSMYTCGPTVYDFAHIGNFRTFVFEDLLKRWLLHLGYDVVHIMNITDVDDKTIAKARNLEVALNTITDYYYKCFLQDARWLKILPANKYPRATGSIDKMVEIIQSLLNNGFAYREPDGSVYFRIKSFSDYGKLSKINVLNQKKTKRIETDEYDKDTPNDFALWKGWKEDDGDVVWNSPWGKGRPGWHIECSAMSMENLGEHFDIHCGGVDNIFPHHENEIAQSVCFSGEKFVNYWLHSEFLIIDDEKMSKTSLNYLTVKDLKKKNFSAESVRYQLLSGHYRTKLSFSTKKKQQSDKAVHRIYEFHLMLINKGALDIKSDKLPNSYYIFADCMNDDLNTPKAIAEFFTWMKLMTKKINQNKSLTSDEIGAAWNYLVIFNDIFSFINQNKNIIPANVKDLIRKRDIARSKREWGYADEIRSRIKELGWLIDDTPDGQKVKKA